MTKYRALDLGKKLLLWGIIAAVLNGIAFWLLAPTVVLPLMLAPVFYFVWVGSGLAIAIGLILLVYGGLKEEDGSRGYAAPVALPRVQQMLGPLQTPAEPRAPAPAAPRFRGYQAGATGGAPPQRVQPGQPALLGIAGGYRGQTLALAEGQPLVLGRDQACANVPLDDEQVSRTHAQLMLVNGQIVVRDLGSSNGTYVNGERVAHAVLQPGDVVRMGDTEFAVGE
jgi:hypothetical protein